MKEGTSRQTHLRLDLNLLPANGCGVYEEPCTGTPLLA